MCLAVPARIISLDASTGMAVVNLSGIHKEVSTVLIDDAAIGDYVLIHVGYALHKLSEEEAYRTLAMFDELAQMNEAEETLDEIV